MSVKSWDDYFLGRSYLIIDGALGTCIEKKGEVLNPKLWSAGHLVTNPSIIQQIHKEYLSAGADIITTSAYQISYEGFTENYQYCTDQVNDLLRLSTDLALSAVKSHATNNNGRKFVAASIGCYGAHLANGSESFGGYTLNRRELFDWHLPKVQLLLQTNPDILAFETVPVLEEVRALTNVIGSIERIPSWISIACKSPLLLNGGDKVEDVCRVIEDPDDFQEGITAEGTANRNDIAIGVNCTDPGYVSEIISLVRENSHKSRRIVAYPNRGDFWNETTNSYDDPTNWSPEQFADKASEWFEAGATILGGCCKTDPTFIRALSDKLQIISSKNH